MNPTVFKLVLSTSYTHWGNEQASFPVYLKKKKPGVDTRDDLKSWECNKAAHNVMEDWLGQIRTGGWVSRGLFCDSSGPGHEQKLEFESSFSTMCWGQTHESPGRYLLTYKVRGQIALVTTTKLIRRRSEKMKLENSRGSRVRELRLGNVLTWREVQDRNSKLISMHLTGSAARNPEKFQDRQAKWK